MLSSVASLLVIRFWGITKFFKTKELYTEDIQEEKTSALAVQGVNSPGKISPSVLSFPTLGLNLRVTSGVIIDNEWTLFDDQASWLSTSNEPGEGNVIIYAHNRPGLFGDLDKLALGDEIIIDHSNGRFKYSVTDSHKVKPNEIEAVLSGENRLTLYTCDGAFDQKRLIVIAEPSN